MYKKIFEEFNSIKAPETAVNETLRKAMAAENSQSLTNNQRRFTPRKLVAVSLVACLAIVFVATMIIGLNGGYRSSVVNTDEHNFVISANAAKLGDRVDDAVIGAFSGLNGGGWSMYLNYEYRFLPEPPNYFVDYSLSDFSIKGKNIEKVTFSVESEGVYFALSSRGHVQGFGDASSENRLGDFSDYDSLTNSQYTKSQLAENSDGLSYGTEYCDSFTYNNTGNKQEIKLGNLIEIIAESNNSDPHMSAILDEMWECEERILEIRNSYDKDINDAGRVSAEQEKLYNRISELSDELQKIILDGVIIDVTVTYKDSTVSKEELRLSMEPVTDEDITYNWLVIR